MDEDDSGQFSEATYDACFRAMTPAEHKLMDFIGEGYKAKQIERRGGGSFNWVNTQTREIRRRLGPLPNGALIERAELGRAYRAWKGRQEAAESAGQRIDLYPVDVPKPPDPGADGGVDHGDTPVGQGRPLAEEQQAYSAPRDASALLDLVPLRTDRRPHNDLNSKVILIAFVIMVCLALMAAGSSAALLEAFNSLEQK